MNTQAAPIIEVSAHDLPVHCPNPQMEQWNTHPRVYLTLDHGVAICPYCSTEYRLKAGEKITPH